MATDRLRRHVGGSSYGGGASGSRGQGQDGFSSSAMSSGTENFCLIGTPLPALDSGKRDPNEYKPVWQQEVRDEQGRRRFHGAFTGGFSAGYFNTVGSKEGWTPSTFYSSRKDKTKQAGRNEAGGDRLGQEQGRGYSMSRPEDFVDEEDLADLRESKGRLQGNDTYQQPAQESVRDPLMDIFGLGPESSPQAGVSRLDAADIAVQPTSLGSKILQRMGWKSGQGIGPRISWTRRKRLRAMLGLKSSTEDDEEPPPTLKNPGQVKEHLYAPPDTVLIRPSNKSNKWGLGWIHDGKSKSLSEALKRAHAEERGPSTGAGFGIGALETESDGEEEVYSTGTRIEDSILARAHSMRPSQWNSDREKLILGEKEKTKRLSTEPDNKTRSSDCENTWRDGSKMLPGFTLAKQATEKELWFPGPEVPRDWEPDPNRVWSSLLRDGAGRNNISKQVLGAHDRGAILGEARIPGPPPSIMNYLSARDRERLDRVKAEERKAVLPRPSETQNEQAHSQPRKIPTIDAAMAKAALRGYMPFEGSKLERYRAYLQTQAESERASQLAPAPDQSIDAFHNELNEFAKSAAIYKPMSFTMANRFESSVLGATEMKTLEPGLFRPEKGVEASPQEKAKLEEERLRREAAEEEARQQKELDSLSVEKRNARLGNYGPGKTRTKSKWVPDRLLCKRFNVSQPHRAVDDGSQDTNTLKRSELFDEFGESRVIAKDLPDVKVRWEAGKRELQKLASARAWESHKQADEVQEDFAPPADMSPESSETANPPTARKESQTASSFKPFDLGNVGLGESMPSQEEAHFVKPPMDIFKAVFADSESEESEAEEKAADAQVPGRRIGMETSSASEINVEESKGPQFKLRKAVDAGQDSANRLSQSSSSKDAKKKKEKKKRRNGVESQEKKGRGLLTFSLDDGEDDAPPREDREGKESLAKSKRAKIGHEEALEHKHRDEYPFSTPADAVAPERAHKSRMRASDLF